MLNFLKRLFGGGGEAKSADDYSTLTLPFEFVVVPGRDALQERAKLMSRQGVTPVIMGARDDVRLIEEAYGGGTDDAAAIIARAGRLDVARWIRAQREADPEQFAVESAEWPSGPAGTMELSVHLDVLSRRPKAKVVIGLVPTTQSWQVPAFVRYGGWNDCPEPDVHVAMHGTWHRQFGADIACMSGDTIECIVRNPPSSREAAMALAQEQFVYCSDIIHQGVGSVEALAATLLNGRTWYFWWD